MSGDVIPTEKCDRCWFWEETSKGLGMCLRINREVPFDAGCKNWQPGEYQDEGTGDEEEQA